MLRRVWLWCSALLMAGVAQVYAQEAPTTVDEAITGIATDTADQILPVLVAVGSVIGLVIAARFGYNWIKRAAARG